MPSYISLHAQLYDTLYFHKNYLKEARFVHRIFKKNFSKRPLTLLEIACGTGNHSFLFENLGYNVTALDNSLPMLRVARKKAKDKESSVTFLTSDMRQLQSFSKPFDGAVCLFDSIGYALTNEGILSTLKGIHKNLRNDGLCILEFWHAAAMIRNFEKKRVRKIRMGDTIYTRISETTLNYPSQTGIIKYTIRHNNGHGRVQSAVEIQRNRFFSVQEINLFLSVAGFEQVEFYSGFTMNKKIDSNTWHVVVVAKKRIQ